ncbi:Sodium/hydrogen exchanger [Aphelenchoides fujianensis]|nr:Sodium/hydrogen exchanger [Aphelenchoides fujianensis]
MKTRLLFLLCIAISIKVTGANPDTGKNVSTPIIGLHWDHVEAPMMVSIWLLIASVAKILFHVNKKFGEAFPDSALLIVVGLLLGMMLESSQVQSNLFTLNATTFFLYLLPPIIFDAGYFMPNRQLFENFGSVMTFAVFGTIWNFVAIGVTLVVCSRYGLFTVDFSFAEALLFSSLISAVDPVAVITVFEEIHVNEFLFINVFGEALFNDGIAAAIFQVFDRIVTTGAENLQTRQYVEYSGALVAIALGGVCVGVLMAFVCSLATRFTQRVKIVGPVFIFVFPYMSYLIAEMFGLSAILAICSCGIVMKQYVKGNITHEAASSVKYFVKMLSQASETVLFMFLGLSTMSSHQYFDLWFVVVTLVSCLVFRTIGVIIQCAILNRYTSKKFTFEDQFILSYGGLRGAIAFGLLSSVPDSVAAKDMFATTTIIVICFTVFLQGSTIRPLLSLLKVEKAEDRQITMIENVYNKYFDYTMTGIEDIVGQKGKHSIRDWFERMNAKVLKPMLVKHTTRNVFDASQIVRAYNKITLQEAMQMTHNRDKQRSTSVKSLPPDSAYKQRQTFNEFMASTENVDRLYGMMRNLLIEMQQNEVAATAVNPPVLRHRRPPPAVAEPEGDENDDIKDDYIAAINRPSPRLPRRDQRNPRLAGGRSEPLTPHSRLARQLSQPVIRENHDPSPA